MECRHCQYPLWKIRERLCPECGTVFSPANYEFVANAVVFLCPHCEQQYFGTDARGHLEPPSFTCVRCANPIGMDQMVLARREDIQVQPVLSEPNPMLARTGLFAPTWRTITYSLQRPVQLLRVTPVESSLRTAVRFCVTVLALAVLGGSGLFCCAPFMAARGISARSVPWEPLVAVGSIVLGTFVLAGAWLLAIHLILRVVASPAHGLRRTTQGFCYTSGVMALGAIPLVGHMIWPIALVVWACLAAEALARELVVSRWRAYLSTLAPLLLVIAAGFVGVFWMVHTINTAARRTVGQVQAMGRTLAIGSALDVQGASTGFVPHAADLITDPLNSSFLQTDALGTGRSRTPLDAPLDLLEGRSLAQLWILPTDQRAALAARVKDRLGQGPVRLGDVVFLAGGEPYPTDPASPLWLALRLPGQGEDPEMPIAVVLARGRTEEHAPGDFPAALAAQNLLRESRGLAPLPDVTALPDRLENASPDPE